MPYKVFVAGEEALAADANQYLMSQTVPRFTNAAQRTSQLTAPVLNQLSITDDKPTLQRYTGSAWVDIPGALCRWVGVNPNVVANVPQDLLLTSFTMPFAGAVHMNGQVNATAGGGATALEITITGDPSPGSTPIPNAAVPGAGGSMPANLTSVSFPISAAWNLAAGVLLTVKVRVSSSAGASMGAVISAMSAQFLISPTAF